MSRILYIVDDLPDPPRNGITIPSYYHLRGLSRQHEVSLLYIKPHKTPVDPESLNENRRLVKELFVLNAYAKTRVAKIMNEILCRQPGFASYQLDENECHRLFQGLEFDVLWGATIRPISCFSTIEEVLVANPQRLKVAAISDCYTSLLRSMGHCAFQTNWPLTSRIRNSLSWMRSWGMAHMETKLLSQVDVILTQTSKDKEWISTISQNTLTNRTYVLPNGVNGDLFRVPFEKTANCVGHIGALDNPEHARTISWLLDRVWPIIKAACPSARLRIIGREGKQKLMNRIHDDERIDYVSHAEKERDLYTDISILIGCNYKGIGLINRTVQAMASGVVVVAHAGTFNGIEGFESHVHGYTANRSRDFAKTIIELLQCPEKQKATAEAARNIIKKKFTWESRYVDLDTVLAKY